MNERNIIRDFLMTGMLSIAATGVWGQPVFVSDSALFAAPGVGFSTTAIRTTSAVSTATGDALYKTPAANITNSMGGLMNGLTLIQGSGEPGNDNASWMIRGIGSFAQNGFNSCKIFVDGFEVNSNYLSSMIAAEIETISILKDGAALAMLGDRGANGAIWIVTKRGKNGPSTVSARMRTGIQAPTKVARPLGAYDYAYLYNVANSNDHGQWTPVYSNQQLQEYSDGQGIDVDWYDEVMRDAGTYVDGDVTFNGGNELVRYNIVFGYLNQQGLYDVKNDRDATSNLQLARYNVRANLDFTAYKIFEARVDIGGRLMDRRMPNINTSDLMNNIAVYPANIYNVYDDPENTHYSGTSTYPSNPVASIRNLGFRLYHNRILQGNFSLKEKLDFLLPGLYLSQSFSFNSFASSGQDKTKDYTRYMNGEVTTTNKDEPMTASGWYSRGMEDWKQAEVTAGYDRTHGLHSIPAIAGMYISAFKGDGYFSYKYNYLSYRARANYLYDNRFAAEFGMSLFGNDAYAPDQRWSFYPTVSGAWILSNEGFLSGNKNINFLKLRASFGMVGSSDSESTNNLENFSSNGRYLYKDYYSTWGYGGGFYTGATSGTQQTPLRPMFISNKNAHAETSYKYNIGIDASFFDRKLNVSADAYLDKRNDIMVYDRSQMQYYGLYNTLTNSGKMTNKGFEVAAFYNNKVGDWSYTLSGMIAYNHNKVDNYGEVPPKYAYNASTGRPLGSIIGLVADGFYDVEDFNGTTLKPGTAIPAFGDVQPGDLKYKDLDENGVIDDDDVTKIGKSQYPEWTYSFGGTVRFRNLDLGVMLQGIAGASYNLLVGNTWGQSVPFIANRTVYAIADNAWAYYPEQNIDTRANATYPRLTTLENSNNYRTSSFWVKDYSYLKVRTIELGYTIDLPKSKISNLRIGLTVTNPFAFSKTLSDYDMDPESIGICYPSLKSYILGVSVSF